MLLLLKNTTIPSNTVSVSPDLIYLQYVRSTRTPCCLADIPAILKVTIDRSPVQVVGTFHTTVTKAIAEARKKREGGDPDWWRPLEASLAVIGSQSEDVLTCIEDELDSGRAKPINIDYLLVEVIPSFLSLDGESHTKTQFLVPSSGYDRVPIPARARICFRQSVCSSVASRDCGKLLGCCDQSHRE